MTRSGTILLVEDDDDDAELTTMAFHAAGVVNPFVRVDDGVDALDYLFCRGTHQGRLPCDLPVVVLLDLKLPRVSGLEVLAAIREDQQTKTLPVVILTSSIEENDRMAAYSNHANSYVRKPVDHEQFVKAARQLGLYWLLLNVPPPDGVP